MPPLEGNKMMEGGDEEDLVVQAGKPSLKCPLTQRLLEDPVKSPECGHVFSRAAIQAVSRQDNMQCPVAGCNRKLSMRRLQPDPLLQRRLERQQNRIFV